MRERCSNRSDDKTAVGLGFNRKVLEAPLAVGGVARFWPDVTRDNQVFDRRILLLLAMRASNPRAFLVDGAQAGTALVAMSFTAAI